MKSFFALFSVLLFLLCFCLYSARTQEQKKMNVVVIPPSASGDARESTAQALTSIIADELSNSTHLKVTSRADLEKILKEQSLSASGYCEQSCQIELGKLLNSKWVVTGDLTKLGKKYILNLKVLNVVTGEIAYQDKETYVGEAEDELEQPARTLSSRVRSFLEKIKATDTSPDIKKDVKTQPSYTTSSTQITTVDLSKQKDSGTVKIVTTPPGATVILDAENIGQSPLMLKVTPGAHNIVLLLTGYENLAKEVFVEKEKFHQLIETLAIIPGTLSVSSNPSGASVYIDNAQKGQTPLELTDVSAGTHTVRVENVDYESQEKTVEVKFKETTQCDFTLTGLPGKLAVITTPSGADVYVDGKEAGKTPLYGYQIQSGAHALKIVLSGYKRIKEKMEISPGQPKTMNFTLETSEDNATGDMVLIPAGEFYMGNDEEDCKLAGCNDDEKPKHKVYLDAYSIDKYEVTNAQYKECVAAGKCEKPQDTTWYNDSGKANHPVVNVDWNMADTFCKWAGKRLPTEAEWEKAARGENGNIWPWGNEFDCKNSCNSVSPCKQESTCVVGSYVMDESSYGVMDMGGNVRQWVSDWYDANYYKNASDQNPKGPNSGKYKVLRGGSWFYDVPLHLRGADRYRVGPSNGSLIYGFRCAQ